MEPPSEPLKIMTFGTLEDNLSLEQRRLAALMEEAYRMLYVSYNGIITRGLLETELGSSGVLNALARLLAEHCACHALNAGFKLEHLDEFIDGMLATVKQNFLANYDTGKEAVLSNLQQQAEKETKQ